MKVKYDDGLLKVDFEGEDEIGIHLIERIADYEEAKYDDYNAGEFNWFKTASDNGF